jgi:hypothetical protein
LEHCGCHVDRSDSIRVPQGGVVGVTKLSSRGIQFQLTEVTTVLLR